MTPSPYDGERPRCHHTCSTTPSRYFSSSQASRLLPMPAWPTSDTRRAAPLAPDRVELLLQEAQLVGPADERRLEGVGPPGAAALADDTDRQPGRDGRRPCPSAPGRRRGRTRSRPRRRSRVASPTRTPPGGATDWSRAAVLTRSPVTIPWPSAPRVTAASPVRTPTRTCEIDARLLAECRDHVDEVEARADRPLGVVLVGDRGAPHRHHGIADELLDDAAVAVDDDAGSLEIAGPGGRASSPDRGRPRWIVKPTRSANRTETTRRSVATARGSATVGSSPAAGRAGLAPPRFVPQLPQNRAPAGFVRAAVRAAAKRRPAFETEAAVRRVGRAAVRAGHSGWRVPEGPALTTLVQAGISAVASGIGAREPRPGRSPGTSRRRAGR